jgi:cytochrome c peroxidase
VRESAPSSHQTLGSCLITGPILAGTCRRRWLTEIWHAFASGGDRNALSPEARRGLKLFRGKANCTACHAGSNLTDEEFHNTGVAWRDGKLRGEGRHVVTKDDADRGAFKTPMLRQVSQTAPYMHDGSLATVVERYNRGGIPIPYLDREIRPLNLRRDEREDLVAFLASITGKIRFEPAGDEPKRAAASVR